MSKTLGRKTVASTRVANTPIKHKLTLVPTGPMSPRKKGLLVEYQKLQRKLAKMDPAKNGFSMDTSKRLINLAGEALRWAEIGAELSGMPLKGFVATWLTRTMDGMHGSKTDPFNKWSCVNTVEVVQFGQCGRFETLNYNPAGFCILIANGRTKAINLQESVRWFARIQTEEWWGTYDYNEEGRTLWLNAVADQMSGLAEASVDELNRVHYPERRAA